MLSTIRNCWALALAASLILTPVAAQVKSDCDPRERDDCKPNRALSMQHNFIFNSTPPKDTWEVMAGKPEYTSEGAVFKITKQGESTTLRSKFYFFGGRAEVWMKCSHGIGIISSIMWLSDVLDEVDWEMFGTKNNEGSTNYFGKGEPDFKNAKYHPMQVGVQDDFHNYTTVWTREKIDWYIDGALVRTLLPKEANNTRNYPQTPMRISLGIWAGGDPNLPQGTREWAGGDTDYSQGPFKMIVKSVDITDFNTGAKEYAYGDRSGSWESIKIVEGNSTVEETINTPPVVKETVSEKFNKLSPTAKIAIYASAAGVGGVFLIAVLWYCIKQRRRGAREAHLAEQRDYQERMELERFKKEGVNPDSFTSTAAEYKASDMRKEGMADSNSYSAPTAPAVAGAGGLRRSDEKTWEMANLSHSSNPADGMRSPVPLLQDGAQSPRVTSPGPSQAYSPATPYGMHNAHSSPPQQLAALSPMRTASPGMPPQFPPPASPHRSASSPHAYMRGQSPAVQQGYGMDRSQSPANMMPPRSASAAPQFHTPQGFGQALGHPQAQPMGPPIGQAIGQAYSHGPGYNQPPSNSGGYGNDPYWNNGYR